jgi:hypothetical protein
MRHRLVPFLVASAMLINAPLLAAEDAGLTQAQASGRAAVRSGMGARATVNLRFGGKDVVRGSEKLRLGLQAGPVIQRENGRTLHGGALSLSTAPGYDARLKLAGQDIAVYQTRLGAAEDAKEDGQNDQDGKKDKKGPSTLGWIGIGVGALVVVTLVAGAIALGNICDPSCD